MYPRINYEMTKEDLEVILEACKPTPCMMIGSFLPSTPQENANRAWQSLGEKMGFDHMTVQSINGKGEQFFSAVPRETKDQKEARLAKEAKEERQNEIDKLEGEISKKQKRLDELYGQTN